MRRRRHLLQVSTFPFLAVLLCTMGSLILVLLVIDRRAKAVALAKAKQEAAKLSEQDEKSAAAQAAEWERRRQALHRALEDQTQQLQDQIRATQEKTEQSAQNLESAKGTYGALQARLQKEQADLALSEQEASARKSLLEQQAQKSEAARMQLVRLSAELASTERALAELRTARQRQAQTYSLVPYRGKHGDNRRPIYVECTGWRVIFHPNRKQLTSPLDIRAEVERRLAEQDPKAGAYLLLLLRPSGIQGYYQTLAALEGLKLDFGYELIDEDWALDFSGDEAKPWTPNKAAPLPIAEASKDAPAPAVPSGLLDLAGGRSGPTSGTGTGSGEGTPVVGINPGGGPFLGGSNPRPALGVPSGRLDIAGDRGGPTGGSGEGTLITGNNPGTSLGGSNPGPSGLARPGSVEAGSTGGQSLGLPGREPVSVVSQGQPGARSTAGGPHGEPDGPEGAGVALAAGAGNGVSSSPAPDGPEGAGTPSVGAGDGVSSSPADGPASLSLSYRPPLSERRGGAEEEKSSAAIVSREGASASGNQEAGAPDRREPEGGFSRFMQTGSPEPKGKPLPPPPVFVNRDLIIRVECGADGVIVRPGGQRIPQSALTQGPVLLQAVRAEIDLRQTLAGDRPYRPQVRFQVRPDGVRSYYLAYPVLEALRVPMTRENLDETSQHR